MHKQVKTLVFSNVLKLGVTHIWASVFITIAHSQIGRGWRGGVFSMKLTGNT